MGLDEWLPYVAMWAVRMRAAGRMGVGQALGTAGVSLADAAQDREGSGNGFPMGATTEVFP